MRMTMPGFREAHIGASVISVRGSVTQHQLSIYADDFNSINERPHILIRAKTYI